MTAFPSAKAEAPSPALSSRLLVATRSSIIMISCLLSSSVHALLLPATRPEITTNHPATSRLRTPVMKGQESFPQSMSEDQLARIRIEAMWKEIEATAVWLNCPTLSVEEGRELGADWSVVSERFKRFLKDEKKVRAWAVAEVGKDPDSRALHVYTAWWAAVRELHETVREEHAALDHENSPNWQRAYIACKRRDEAKEEARARYKGLRAAGFREPLCG